MNEGQAGDFDDCLPVSLKVSNRGLSRLKMRKPKKKIV